MSNTLKPTEIKISDILNAEKVMKKAKTDFEKLVHDYIEVNVDPESWESIDRAILELPECQNKIFIYDWMTALEKKDK